MHYKIFSCALESCNVLYHMSYEHFNSINTERQSRGPGTSVLKIKIYVTTCICTCIRLLRSLVRLCFTIITNDRLCHRPEVAPLAGKSFIFCSFVTRLAYIWLVRSARAAIATWKCCGFWWIPSGISGGKLSAKLPQSFLCKAMALVTGEVQPQHEGH